MGRKNVYERFIWFDKEARSGKYPNATTLARRFEVSSKTAQRDIDFIRDRLHAPIEYDRSSKGYCYNDETYSLPSIFLSSDELSSLLIARKLLRDVSGGHLGAEIGSIVDKLTGFLDSHSLNKQDIERVISLKHIEYLPADDRVFMDVLEGCVRRKKLLMHYRTARDSRVVEPYHIFNYKGTWHLLAHCHNRDSVRDFVLGRVASVKVLDETFPVPKGFDPEGYFAGSFGLFRGEARKKVVLRFSPDAAGWVSGQIWHENQETRFLKDGSFELSFAVEKLAEVKSEVLKYGSLVEVIRPRELREIVGSEAREVAGLYKK